MDIFLFPQMAGVSTRNTSVMTALAHGKPIVTYLSKREKLGGYTIPESIFIPENDQEQFIKSAAEYLHETRQDAHSTANADYYRKHFSWPAAARQYQQGFERPEALK